MLLVVQRATWFSKTGFRKKIAISWVFFLQSISGIGNKNFVFLKKKLHFGGNKSFSRAVGFVENKGKWTSSLLFTGFLVLVF